MRKRQFKLGHAQSGAILSRVRVLVATTHALIGDIVSDALSGHQDIEVVSVRWDAARIATEASELAPDIMILNHRASESPGVFKELLDHRPAMRVLSIVSDGCKSFLYALCPREVSLGELSPEGLVAAVREAVPRDRPHAGGGS